MNRRHSLEPWSLTLDDSFLLFFLRLHLRVHDIAQDFSQGHVLTRSKLLLRPVVADALVRAIALSGCVADL